VPRLLILLLLSNVFLIAPLTAEPLRLVTHIADAPHSLVEVTNGKLLVEHAGRRIPAPPDAVWTIEGDPAALLTLADWSPAHLIRRSPKPDHLHPPEGAWIGRVLVTHQQGLDPLGKPVQSRFLARWPEALGSEGTVVTTWLIDGRPGPVRLNTYRALKDGYLQIQQKFDISPPSQAGQAITLIWQDGIFLKPAPHFASASAESAFIAARRDDTATLAPLLAESAVSRATDAEGATILHHAADAGSLGAVRLLLAKGASPDARDFDKRTPLHYAAAQGRALIVATLLAAKSQPDARDTDERTPLSYAAERGHTAVAEALVAVRSVRVERPDNEGRTPLRLALSLGHADVARLLLARAPTALNFKDKQNARVLTSLAARGRTEAVRLMLERGTSPDALVRGSNALLGAARHDDPFLIDALLEAGTPPDLPSAEGVTPLMIAALSGHSRLVDRLLLAGASPTARTTDGRRPLHFAVLSDDPATVTALLTAAPAEALAETSDQLSPLILALILRAQNSLPLIEKHIGDGPWLPIRAEQRAPFHYYALFVALAADRVFLVRSALAHGWSADTLFADWPALRLARLYGAAESSALLSAAGATATDDLPLPLASGSELDDHIALLRHVRPEDPRDAQEDFPPAFVRVEFILGANGEVLFPRVLESSNKRLSYAVLSALPEWRFTPPRRGGNAVATRVVLPIAFPSSADRAYEIGQIDVMPRVLHRTAPDYPIALRRDGGEGRVTLRFEVSPLGLVENIVVSESNHPAYEAAAIAALEKWRFTPGRRDGEPVRVSFFQTMSFTLQK